MARNETLWLDAAELDALIAALARRGRIVVGPTVRDGAIVYERISAVADLPAGWTDAQDAGRYRLERRAGGAFFGYAVGPCSWKRFLLPPRERLFAARREGAGIVIEPDAAPAPAYAFLGVRPCELAAMGRPDARPFLVAVQCGAPSGCCFCASMGTGPRAAAGFDLGLTELVTDAGHGFVVEVGSEAGDEVLRDVRARPATPEERDAAAGVTSTARERMGRTLDTAGLAEKLRARPEHPAWEDVARRCTACGNCTMVCPTCACWTVEDTTDLAGTRAERWRRWDSCFTTDFTSLKEGPARASVRARHRHWVNHKLTTASCVGCGRCITWCPIGIDLTETAKAVAS